MTLLCLASLLYSNVFATTFSTVNQAVPLLISLVAFLFSCVVYRLNTKRRELSLLHVLIALTAAYFSCRAYFSPVKMYFKQDYFLLAQSFFLFFSIQLIHLRTNLVKWILGFIVILLVLNLIALIPSVDHYRDNYIDYANGRSGTGLFNHQNFFSNALSLLISFSFGFLFYKKLNLGLKSIFFVLLIAGVVAVITSGSRGGTLSLLAGLFISWVLQALAAPHKISRLYHILTLSLVVIGFFMGITLLKSRSDEGASKRVEAFSMGVDQIFEAPFLGSGSRSYEYISYQYWPLSMGGSSTNLRYVHNEYLQIIDDYGLIGLLLFLIIALYTGGVLIKSILSFSEKIKSSNKDSVELSLGFYSSLGSFCALIVILTHSLVSFPFHGFVNVGILALLISVGMTQHKHRLNNFIELTVIFPISGVIVALASIGISSEIKAKKIFRQYQIEGDDLNFYVERVDRNLWAKALDQVVRVAPNFERYNKLGSIYVYDSGYVDSQVEADQLRNKAIDCYVKSQKLHPYNHASSLELAKLYEKAGRYELAEAEYRKSIPYFQRREKYFRVHLEVARFYVFWAHSNTTDHKLVENQLNNAQSALDNHLKYVQGVENYQSMGVQAAILFSRGMLYSRMKKSEDAIKCCEQLLVFKGKFNYHAELVRSLAFQLSDLSEFLWMENRKPKEALEYFKVAQSCFDRYDQLVKIKAGKIERRERNQEIIQFLISAGF